MRKYYPKGRRNLCFDCAVYVAAVFLPPLAVFMVRGCHIDFAVNILLTIMGLIPGMIHAIYVVIKHPDKRFGIIQFHFS
ncbi:hypothetical protein BKA69DRAFT_1077227 [Paraphysoderma sedebokerense]|nr:hypothetical protein BKA69DRAFT_1077227 [Paraphysoderma sedebokerense]